MKQKNQKPRKNFNCVISERYRSFMISVGLLLAVMWCDETKTLSGPVFAYINIGNKKKKIKKYKRKKHQQKIIFAFRSIFTVLKSSQNYHN